MDPVAQRRRACSNLAQTASASFGQLPPAGARIERTVEGEVGDGARTEQGRAARTVGDPCSRRWEGGREAAANPSSEEPAAVPRRGKKEEVADALDLRRPVAAEGGGAGRRGDCFRSRGLVRIYAFRLSLGPPATPPLLGGADLRRLCLEAEESGAGGGGSGGRRTGGGKGYGGRRRMRARAGLRQRKRGRSATHASRSDAQGGGRAREGRER
jgi:hypothetical protein